MRRALLYVISVYASVPVLIYLFPWILGHIVFSHLCKYSSFDQCWVTELEPLNPDFVNVRNCLGAP